MEVSKVIEMMSDVELFKELDTSEKKIIALHFEEITFAANEMIFIENSPRKNVYVIIEGGVNLIKKTPLGEERLLAYFSNFDTLGEGALLDDSPHSTSARAVTQTQILMIRRRQFNLLIDEYGVLTAKIISNIAKIIDRRMRQASSKISNAGTQYHSGRTRSEHDLLGDLEVPYEAYYGIQTLRGVKNFNISGASLSFYPVMIEALAMVKMAAAQANFDLGLLVAETRDAIVQACNEIMNGKLHNQFVIDMIQGGAGTSSNMNANEVIANRALEILGHKKGDYENCHPNNHVNLSQSTNDAYPTAIKIALMKSNRKLVEELRPLIISFRRKANEFKDIIKMGRTQLQDAVPMTLGQAFEAYAVTLEEEIQRLEENAKLFLEVNMGATAIGTGINADPDYNPRVISYLRDITGFEIVLAPNLVEATQDTGAFVMYSSAIKRLAVKLSKICNDLRLISSGPRAGINEINLPPMQPGSSIMPGKVNPVIPEVVNQVAFKVIGNDLTVTMAAEAGQLELNVMEPVIVQSLFESIDMLKNGMKTLKYRCIDGISANKERCLELVTKSIGLVTALNPVLGYEVSTKIAKDALMSNKGVYDLILERKLIAKEDLDQLLLPENMIKPRKLKP